MISSGLLLFVFGVANEVAFAIYDTLHFFIFSSNKCANYPNYKGVAMGEGEHEGHGLPPILFWTKTKILVALC